MIQGIKQKVLANKRKSIFILIAIIIFLALDIYIISTIYFSIGHDLSISITPNHKSLYLVHGQGETVNFTLSTSNHNVCSAYCEYSLYDEKNNILLSGNTTLKPGKALDLSYSFISPEKGSGQRIYSADFKCRNIKSFVCQTSATDTYARSIVTMNYDLTAEEKNSSGLAREYLQSTIDEFRLQDIEYQKTAIILSQIQGKINLKATDADVRSASEKYLAINSMLLHMTSLWDKEEYYPILQESSRLDADMDSFIKSRDNIQQNMTYILNNHNLLVSYLNTELQDSKDMASSASSYIYDSSLIAELNASASLNEHASRMINTVELQDHKTISAAISQLAMQTDIARSMMLADDYSAMLNGEYLFNTEQDVLCSLKGKCLTPKQYPYSEDIKKNSASRQKICSDIKRLSKSQLSADKDYAYSYFLIHYPANTTYNDDAVTSDNVIDFLTLDLNIAAYKSNPEFGHRMQNILNAQYAQHVNNKIMLLNNRTGIINENITAFNAKIASANDALSKGGDVDININGCIRLIGYANDINETDHLESSRREMLISNIYSYCAGIGNITDVQKHEALQAENPATGTGSSKLQLPYLRSFENSTYIQATIYTITDPAIAQLPSDIFMIAYAAQNSNTTSQYYNSYCIDENESYPEQAAMLLSINKRLENIRIEPVIIDNSAFMNISTRINMTLKQHKPICCVRNTCMVCSESRPDNPATYPVIFVHGHAMNKGQSPLYSMNAFNSLQNALESDGYVNAGIILPTSRYADISENEWGKISLPVSVKYSYYYGVYDSQGTITDVVANSESITTYAQRLNDAVALMKYRTGKDKVIIIAHSMGGLVSREYVKEFGDGSVHKLVMIGTPNNGIDGRVYNLCPVLGEEKECDDMYYTSNFIKELNAFNFSATGIKYYTIVGTGCDMGGQDGDGVVTAESVKLPYAKAYYVNGTCDKMFEPLHSAMLNTQKYPITYAYLQQIVEE